MRIFSWRNPEGFEDRLGESPFDSLLSSLSFMKSIRKSRASPPLPFNGLAKSSKQGNPHIPNALLALALVFKVMGLNTTNPTFFHQIFS